MFNQLAATAFDYFPDHLIALFQESAKVPFDNLLLERSLETPDWSTEQLWNVAGYYHSRMNFPRAIKYYFRLLQWTEHEAIVQAQVLQAIGHLFLLAGQYTDARDSFRRAAQIQKNPKLAYYLADCYRHLQQTEAEVACLLEFVGTYSHQDSLLCRAFARLSQTLDYSGLASEARDNLLEGAKALNSWGFVVQAQAYQPMLPAENRLPQIESKIEGEKFFPEEFSEIYVYRACWQQEQIKSWLEAQSEEIHKKLLNMQVLEKLSLAPDSVNGRRIAIVGAFNRPDCEPYLDALISLCRKFSVTLISTGPMPPRILEEEWLRQVQANEEVLQVYQAIQNHSPDLLIYMDVGPRSSASYLLSNLRLAPVQAVFGIHPMTSGHRNLDYFLSFDWLETESAQQDYTEKLYCLQGTPVQSSNLPDRFIPRDAFNLPADSHHYFCPVTCASIHSQFIPQLAAILRLDPKGQILLPGLTPQSDTRFKELFSQSHNDVADRLHFLPPIDRISFLSLCREVDVILDPLFVGLSYSLWQLIPLGTPIVTWPSSQARGRYAAGLYQKIGITDCLVNQMDEYAEKAVSFAHDTFMRNDFRQRVQDNYRKLFQYPQFLSSLESFIYLVLEQNPSDHSPSQSDIR